MKKALTVILVALLVVGIMSVLVLAGSGGEEDQANVSTEDISKADIGVPVYPGAELGEDDVNSLATTKGEVSAEVLYADGGCR